MTPPLGRGRGGARKGAGRPKGAKAAMTAEAIRRAGEGETPLEYMLRVMRDERVPLIRRDKMAIGAAPYIHARAVEVSGSGGGPVQMVGEIILRGVRAADPHD